MRLKIHVSDERSVPIQPFVTLFCRLAKASLVKCAELRDVCLSFCAVDCLQGTLRSQSVFNLKRLWAQAPIQNSRLSLVLDLSRF
jgi:hypothetical protein